MTALFPYQEQGAKWLTERKTALLADDPGLGKSAQAIAACDAIDAQRILVICPASVRENWRREFNRFSTKKRDVFALFSETQWRLHTGVLIVSYDGAAGKFYQRLMEKDYDVLIVDESHFCKTPTAKRTQMLYGAKGQPGLAHKAAHVWLLSGTPAPNNPFELYPMCRTLFAAGFKDKSGMIINKWAFINKYCTTRDNGFGKVITGGKNLDELRERLQPFVLRRKKADVLKDLPPIRFENLYLTSDKIKLPGDGVAAIKAALDNIGGVADPIAAFRALEKKTGQVATVRRLLGLSKVAPLADWVKEQLESGMENIVIFAYHREVIQRLATALSEVSQIAQITGDTLPHERDAEVQRFQNDPACRVFIGNIIAAGTGITLTAASDLIFAEYSWVPAENEQAAMRVHRIGQKDSVLIRFAIAAGSLDERIGAVVRRKTETITQIFN